MGLFEQLPKKTIFSTISKLSKVILKIALSAEIKQQLKAFDYGNLKSSSFVMFNSKSFLDPLLCLCTIEVYANCNIQLLYLVP